MQTLSAISLCKVPELCLVFERHYDQKLRNICFVYNPGYGEITELSIYPNNLAIKGTFIDPEGI